MDRLVVINACVREKESRTLRIAEPLITSLSNRFEVIRYDLPEMEGIVPLTTKLLAERGRGEIPAWALESARSIASADFILIAAPFWDMSFPAVIKCFFEQVSLFDVTFTDSGSTCEGLCKAPKVLYITTRGMDIPNGDHRELATPYLRALGELWNLGEITTIAAWNMDYSSPDEIEGKISACISKGLDVINTW